MSADLPVDDGTLDLSGVKVGDARPFKLDERECCFAFSGNGLGCTRTHGHVSPHIAAGGCFVHAVWPVDPPAPEPASRVGMRVTARLGESVIHGVFVTHGEVSLCVKADGGKRHVFVQMDEWDVTFTPVLPTTPGSLVRATERGHSVTNVWYLGHDSLWRVSGMAEREATVLVETSGLTNVTVLFDAAPPA